MNEYWLDPDGAGGWYIIANAFDTVAGWHYKTIHHCETKEAAQKLITSLNTNSQEKQTL